MVQKISVSIIMGIYNTPDSQILKKAIDSICEQTFTEWECIICDDGSLDNTYKLLLSLTRQDQRFKIIRNEKNLGLAASLNHCLEYVRGRYIARMDADDINFPDRLEKEAAFLEQNMQYHLVGSAAELFDEEGVWGCRKMPEMPDKRNFLWGSPFIHPTIMIRRETLFQVHGYRVAKETMRTEDYDLFMRLYAEEVQGYNIQEPLYYFREDKAARKRKKYRYRLDEVKIRWRGFCRLRMMPQGILYVIKPLIVGLIPYSLLVRLRGDKRRKRKERIEKRE